MTEKKPTLDYALPPKKKRRPWWIDVPLVLLSATAALIGLWLLAWLGYAILWAFNRY